MGRKTIIKTGIGKKISDLREDKGLKQADFAKIIGVTQSTIQRWESGESNIDHESLKKIAEYFYVSADWLIGLSTVSSPDPDINNVCCLTGLSEKTAFMLDRYVSSETLFAANLCDEIVQDTELSLNLYHYLFDDLLTIRILRSEGDTVLTVDKLDHFSSKNFEPVLRTIIGDKLKELRERIQNGKS